MELQLGITGIQGRKGPAPEPPFSNLRAFHSHCYHAARIVNAKIQSIHDPHYCNYAMARFEFSDSTVAVLLNAVRPIIAFARCPVEDQIILEYEYIDCPRLAEVFLSVGDYTTATSAELSVPLVRAMCIHLAPFELKRIRYFRPARVGDVIFNCWD